MKTTPLQYFGNSHLSTSRIGHFIDMLAKATGKREQDFLFIDPYSIGDCIQALGLLPAFRRVYCEDGQRIIFLSNKRSVGLSAIMPYADHFVGADLAPHELALEYVASLSNRLSPDLPIICAPDMHAMGKISRTGASALTLRKAIFFLGQSEEHAPPIISDGLRADATAAMQAQGVAANTSVILFPHAMTFNDFGVEFWLRLVATLKSTLANYSFYTDTTVGSAPIPGTLPVLLNLGHVLPAVEYAGTGIFLRSGLVELCAWADADVFSIVPPRSLYKYMPATVPPEDIYISRVFPTSTAVDMHAKGVDESEIERICARVIDVVSAHGR